jgi:hypothetical protein
MAALVALALLWNVCVVVIAIVAIRRGSDNGWLLAVGWLPFALVGVALLLSVSRNLWRATAVGATRLEVAVHPFQPGGTYAVLIAQAGRLRADQLEVILECRERATFRQGTDTRTSMAKVVRRRVYSRENIEIVPTRPFEERFEISLPGDAMHSFQTDHNEISWSLVVIGRLERRPDYVRRFPICVYPPLLTAHRPDQP